MIQTLIKGFVFGVGFTLAVALTAYVIGKIQFGEEPSSYTKYDSEWNQLSDDEQIAAASALVVGRYKDGPDGSKIGYVQTIYGDASSTGLELDADIPGSKFYPDQHDDRTGLILLYNDSSRHAKTTLFMYADRIPGFGNMPLQLLVEKFEGDA